MYFGYIAAFLTTASFIPQAIKTIRTHDTEGISVLMYLGFVTGVFFWMVYGILLADPAIIAANFLTFLLALPILVIAARNELRRRREKTAA
ncbi:MAG: SemiSWEET transporter [Parvibaculum sp.]|uniref:SemiSWEET transporter n=1 Tax=Parvibaculum sp. TaxID=2024848 RepID=UPI0025F7A1E3|nr:SemiSWEET transporter [Parvibaculum sp.]MCE9649083.1 SemiSWEET transporter [Parvibaculum sp.]